MNIFILTIGTRDIQLSETALREYFPDKELSESKDPRGNWYARKMGELIIQKLNTLKQVIKTPIITPCLRYLKTNDITINRIYYVVTHQDKSIGELALNDTYEYGTIIKYLTPQLFSYQSQIPKSQLIEIKENVSFLDSMYVNLSKNSHLISLNHNSKIDKLFLLNQGGIDAINTSLLFNLLKSFGRKLIHLSVDQKTQTCFRLEFSDKFLKEKENQEVIALISNFNYGILDTFLLAQEIKNVCQYAHARLQFDFEAARKYLLNLPSSLRSFATSEIKDLQAITDTADGQAGLIKELYINARIKFLQKSYVDFLLRFFRIIEYFSQKSAFELIEAKDYNHLKWEYHINEFFNSHPKGIELKEYLSLERINDQPLDYAKPVIPAFIKIMEFFKHSNTDLIKSIQPLSSLRNKSIGAHDFKPISLTKIEDVLSRNGTTITEVFKTFDDLFGLDFNQNNPFLRINETIKNQLTSF